MAFYEELIDAYAPDVCELSDKLVIEKASNEENGMDMQMNISNSFIAVVVLEILCLHKIYVRTSFKDTSVMEVANGKTNGIACTLRFAVGLRL
jgi:hypothetical protein